MGGRTCVVVGSGHAGVALALRLRREGWTGPVRLLGEEPSRPYHRPPLTKEYLAGRKTREEIALRPPKVYRDHGIELMPGRAVESIDPAGRALRLADGGELAWDALALCTGARPRTLPAGRDRSNVFCIRAADDVDRLRPLLAPGRAAVIVGAGYIGLEAAAALVGLGLKVAVIEAEERVLSRVTGERMSRYMEALHRSRGVDLRTGVRVEELLGKPAVEAVACSDGAELPADLVIVGIGVVPNDGLARAAGLPVDDGVAVDGRCRAGEGEIFAAGDCASFPSALYGRRVRLESVQNANDQARAAAAGICGTAAPPEAAPWFWSEQHGERLQMAGLGEGHDEVVCRGDPEAPGGAGFALFYLKDGVVVAADCVNRPGEFMAGRRLVAARRRIDPERLADESLDPAALAEPPERGPQSPV